MRCIKNEIIFQYLLLFERQSNLHTFHWSGLVNWAIDLLHKSIEDIYDLIKSNCIILLHTNYLITNIYKFYRKSTYFYRIFYLYDFL